MTQHTPGPWGQSHREKQDGSSYMEVYDAAGTTIAVLAWYPAPQLGGSVTALREANARLIAAAPDLLAMLRKTLAAAVELHAQGIGCPDCPTDIEDKVADCPMLEAADSAIAKAEGR